MKPTDRAESVLQEIGTNKKALMKVPPENRVDRMVFLLTISLDEIARLNDMLTRLTTKASIITGKHGPELVVEVPKTP